MTETRFFGGPWLCPTCGIESDHAMGTTGATPKHGDIGMCIECVAFYTFVFKGEQLVGLVALTDDQVDALDAGVRGMLLVAQRAIKAARRA